MRSLKDSVPPAWNEFDLETLNEEKECRTLSRKSISTMIYRRHWREHVPEVQQHRAASNRYAHYDCYLRVIGAPVLVLPRSYSFRAFPDPVRRIGDDRIDRQMS